MDTILIEKNSKSKSLYLDPRTKMFLTIATSTIMISGDGQGVLAIIQPCLAVIPFVFFLLLKRYSTAFKYSTAYILALIISKMFISSTAGILNFLIVGVIGSLTRMLPGLLMGYFLIKTTTVSEFIAVMDRMHVSKKITIPISVMFRFFPTIKVEYNSIKDAMRMRGIKSVRSPIAMLEYRLVPLLMSVVGIGNELSASALTRGLGAPVQRTNICDIGFRWLDILVFTFMIICCIAFAISMF